MLPDLMDLDSEGSLDISMELQCSAIMTCHTIKSLPSPSMIPWIDNSIWV